MTTSKRLGMITPSSNSVLEPVTSSMTAGVTGVTAHFSRFRVTEIALDTAALNQFDAAVMLPAADLLADAKVDAIAWNGTSASWLGVHRDISLCAAITARTGAYSLACRSPPTGRRPRAPIMWQIATVRSARLRV